MKNVRGVIFDMDGLMFDTEKIYYQATKETADELGIPYHFSDYKKLIGVSDEEVHQAYHQAYDDAHGTSLVDRLIQEAYEKGVAYFQEGKSQLKPGLTSLLEKLRIHKIPCVVASSNTRELIDLLLKKHQVHSYFKGIIAFDDVKRAKPDPEIFERAANFLDVPKDSLLILEDSANGILAANRAGIPVIMIPDYIVPTPELRERCLTVLRTLDEVERFLF